ncbi:MAG: acetyl-CoA carboxylase biotin carboxyl carrier protein [Planctomycetes bacterium]|nr:acetyl-CoA carboxylase biotin carboxyl carrier protein [Planctomycetota bacterium]
MANSTPGNSGDISDVRRLRRLVELMNENDLNEIDLRDGETRIRLRKRQDQVVTSYAVAPPAASAAPAARPAASAPDAPASDANLLTIKSPMVGTFYGSANPDSPAFVKVGDHVGPDTTVCIIEAMKVFNEIPAEVSGKVVAVLAKNNDPVEFGQPLFKIDPK